MSKTKPKRVKKESTEPTPEEEPVMPEASLLTEATTSPTVVEIEDLNVETAKTEKKSKSNLVSVLVVKGSLGFLDGKTYEKGDKFETTREIALSIDQNFVKILD